MRRTLLQQRGSAIHHDRHRISLEDSPCCTLWTRQVNSTTKQLNIQCQHSIYIITCNNNSGAEIMKVRIQHYTVEVDIFDGVLMSQVVMKNYFYVIFL